MLQKTRTATGCVTEKHPIEDSCFCCSTVRTYWQMSNLLSVALASSSGIYHTDIISISAFSKLHQVCLFVEVFTKHWPLLVRYFPFPIKKLPTVQLSYLTNGHFLGLLSLLDFHCYIILQCIATISRWITAVKVNSSINQKMVCKKIKKFEKVQLESALSLKENTAVQLKTI